ncbi:PR domain zinc finger protein 13 [Cloeon dipterum]|uniref:PR domain zinc finger protein 13 n=1 Tax=Cloeon dipterum TaxID=197152 RepID=UPI00321FAEF6
MSAWNSIRDMQQHHGRLLAHSAIPMDIFSTDVDVHELKTPLDKTIFVKLSGSGRFEPADATKGWIRAARLAPDCHMGNVRIQRGRRKGCVALRAVRPISAGDELQLWFSEELLAALRIPYLNPANIQGECRYVCHRCSSQFEAPNPLKVHLALNCGADGREEALWSRLVASLSCPAVATDAFPSAFTPWPRPAAPPPPSTLRLVPADLSAHHARMETLVSSLGKSKKGHVCLYCGKIYSRKYGLKIHIRTHTGYKPLSCKFCLRPFGDPSNLNKHVRLHAEGETPYKCDECGKVLVRRRDLERHLKARHTGSPQQTLCGADTDESL